MGEKLAHETTLVFWSVSELKDISVSNSDLCNFTVFRHVVVEIEGQLNYFEVKTLFGHEAHGNLAFVQDDFPWTKVVDVTFCNNTKVKKAFGCMNSSILRKAQTNL